MCTRVVTRGAVDTSLQSIMALALRIPYLLEIVGTNRFAVGAAHDKSAAYRRAAVVDATIHARTVQRDTPAFFISPHDTQSIGKMRGEMRRDVIVWSKNNRKSAADRVT